MKTPNERITELEDAVRQMREVAQNIAYTDDINIIGTGVNRIIDIAMKTPQPESELRAKIEAEFEAQGEREIYKNEEFIEFVKIGILSASFSPKRAMLALRNAYACEYDIPKGMTALNASLVFMDFDTTLSDAESPKFDWINSGIKDQDVDDKTVENE